MYEVKYLDDVIQDIREAKKMVQGKATRIRKEIFWLYIRYDPKDSRNANGIQYSI